MPEQRTNDLLAAIEDIGEVARLLSIFADKRLSACPQRQLIEMVQQTAGFGVRLPKPEIAIQLALRLGLLKKKVNLFELTSSAQTFLKTKAKTRTDFTGSQSKIILSLLGDDPEFLIVATGLFENCKAHSDGSLRIEVKDLVGESAHATASQVLNRLGALKHQDGTLLVDVEYASALSPNLTINLPIAEQRFWSLLDERRIRGREVEIRVLREEKKRLEREGRIDLAPAVVRVSATHPGSNYDIRSFNTDGSDRFIEVKSSTGNRVMFLWSSAERKLATEKRRDYWIYFVPFSESLPEEYCPVVMIRDPVTYVENGTLVEIPVAFEVRAASDARVVRLVTLNPVSPIVEWKPFKRR